MTNFSRASNGEAQMLNIIVVSDEQVSDDTEFAFKERVTAPLLEDPHFAAQLIERVAWAVADAEEAERLVSSGAGTDA
jgi:hypothetical protein